MSIRSVLWTCIHCVKNMMRSIMMRKWFSFKPNEWYNIDFSDLHLINIYNQVNENEYWLTDWSINLCTHRCVYLDLSHKRWMPRRGNELLFSKDISFLLCFFLIRMLIYQSFSLFLSLSFTPIKYIFIYVFDEGENVRKMSIIYCFSLVCWRKWKKSYLSWERKRKEGRRE